MSPTLNIHEAAELLKVHPKTVADLIHACILPAAKIGRAYVLLTRDVMAHLEREVARQTSERMRSPRWALPELGDKPKAPTLRRSRRRVGTAP